MGWDSAVGMTARYWLEGPGIESRWRRDFLHPSGPTMGPTHPLYNGYWLYFPGLRQEYSNASTLPFGLTNLFYGEFHISCKHFSDIEIKTLGRK